MVEEIESLGSDFELETLGEIQAFEKRKVEIGGPAERERVASPIGEGALRGDDILSVGIVRYIGNNGGTAGRYLLA